MTFTGIFAVIIVFGGLIFFHELGHFLIARLFGIGVKTFSIGFGKKLFTHTYAKTEYCLSLIPLGGYVALVGEDDTVELPENFTEKESFALRPTWQRFLVVAAGAFFNIILAVILYFCIFFFSGKPYLTPVVGDVFKDSPAQQAHLEVGDIIIGINSTPVTKWSEIHPLIQIQRDTPTIIEYVRDGIVNTTTIQAIISKVPNIFGEEQEAFVLGIKPSGEQKVTHLTFLSSVKESFITTYQSLALTAESLLKLIQRSVPSDSMGGPIMIAQVINQSSTQGIIAIVSLAALISINLGFINLLPIPVLDGGHILFLTIEMITRRPVSLEWRTRLSYVGLSLLLFLMLFATYNDVMRFFK
ncbi:MAG: RIP metalloprotease RseP [Desulfovibrionaceae bacterium]